MRARIRLEGSPCALSQPQAANLRLIVTELAANAEKHGALARPEGTVCVQWLAFINGSRRLQVRWSETGLSNFVVPEKVGAGTHLLARAAENFERVFEAGGMSCTFELSLEGNHGRISVVTKTSPSQNNAPFDRHFIDGRRNAIDLQETLRVGSTSRRRAIAGARG